MRQCSQLRCVTTTDWHFLWYEKLETNTSLCLFTDFDIVVGLWTLLSDRLDGSTRRHGENPSPVRAYLAGDCANALWQNRSFGLHHTQLGQQCLRMRIDDYDWIAIDLRCVGHELCCSNHLSSPWR